MPAATAAAPPNARRVLMPRWKAVLYTGCFAAVTVVATIYGAGLKTRQELKAAKIKTLEATTEEKIALLEEQRAKMVSQKEEIEQKLERIRARAAASTGS